MDFRTTFNIEPSSLKITHDDHVMFIGSCFASSIGNKLNDGRIPVMINPAGTVYNPASVATTLKSALTLKTYTSDDLHNYQGTWLSFDHYTDFSSDDSDRVLDAINCRSQLANSFLLKTKFLFITFGTARVYRFKKSGKIVSNCHKIQSVEFTREMLSVSEITGLWNNLLDELKSAYPDLKVVFSVSPVRHMKDGAHGNQVSKSTLLLAVEELLNHKSSPGYFPAYEIMIDDLRDYRFYDNDMLHPSSAAVEYIWEAFSRCYLNKNTLDIWNEINGISKALSHRISSGSDSQHRKFAETMIKRIDEVSRKVPSVNLESERDYFKGLL
jgi:hypothetical protein